MNGFIGQGERRCRLGARCFTSTTAFPFEGLGQTRDALRLSYALATSHQHCVFRSHLFIRFDYVQEDEKYRLEIFFVSLFNRHDRYERGSSGLDCTLRVSISSLRALEKNKNSLRVENSHYQSEEQRRRGKDEE